VIVDGDAVRSRLLSPREAAQLMGLSEDYQLPSNYNDAYDLMGDGVVSPSSGTWGSTSSSLRGVHQSRPDGRAMG
jgi:site-specific DNA-cytosine methylase